MKLTAGAVKKVKLLTGDRFAYTHIFGIDFAFDSILWETNKVPAFLDHHASPARDGPNWR